MGYKKTEWENLPSTKTPITNTNLNNIENGIYTILEALGLDTDTYDNTKAYVVGDMVVYESKIFECTTAITTPEDFDNTKWALVPILEEE